MTADAPPRTAPAGSPPRPRRFALVGNPNTGKTTLFNRLCGLRAETANFPGSTVEVRRGTTAGVAPGERWEIVDLPGHYGLNLERPESRLCRTFLAGAIAHEPAPDVIVVVADATNLPRNLLIVSQALQQGLPAVVALSMTDLAQRGGLTIDAAALAERIGCPVVPICGRSGAGLEELRAAMAAPRRSEVALPPPTDADLATEWANRVVEESVGGARAVGGPGDTVTDRLDAAFTHPVLGLVLFAAVMIGLFWTIFTLASIPMDLIELIFARVGDGLALLLPEGAVRDLLVEGVVAGVAGTVVFLPQICLLFFLISVLEDTGYLARAAFVMDRLLCRFGLPGQAFVPLLSAHACAIPALMAARLVPDHRDRLATILVAPFMSCSARLPVYVLLIGILFPGRPVAAGLAFAGCYLLGAVAAILSALLARRTLLRGRAQPMVLELPGYKLPSLRSALVTTLDRGSLFLRKAGTVILAMCIVLWWLGAYPATAEPDEAIALRSEAALVEADDPDRAAGILDEADALAARHATSASFIGRLGRLAEPAFAPIGCDWQLTIGVLSSFAAREVFVSTMTVVVTGRDDDPGEDDTIRRRLVEARRDDGRLLFDAPTAASLLVFYVLAMQCLPTLAVTRRETGSWRWAGLQLAWMTLLAWVAAFLVHALVALGGAS